MIQQTHEQKLEMYMKMPKKKIAEMLIQCNKVLDGQNGAKSSNALVSRSFRLTESEQKLFDESGSKTIKFEP